MKYITITNLLQNSFIERNYVHVFITRISSTNRFDLYCISLCDGCRISNDGTKWSDDTYDKGEAFRRSIPFYSRRFNRVRGSHARGDKCHCTSSTTSNCIRLYKWKFHQWSSI